MNKLQPQSPVRLGDVLPDVLAKYGIEAPKKRFKIWFDGSCEPLNPGGVATSGWIVELDGETAEEGYRTVAHGDGATNNVAEYSALGLALRSIADSGIARPGDALEIMGDSKLVIEQICDRWACNKPHLQRLRARCLELLKQIDVEWSASWIPREENERADALSRKAYEETTGQPYPERRQRT